MLFSISLLPPLICWGGGLVGESVGTADLQSDPFDRKQSRKAIDLQLSSHQSLVLSLLPSSRVRLGISH